MPDRYKEIKDRENYVTEKMAEYLTTCCQQSVVEKFRSWKCAGCGKDVLLEVTKANEMYLKQYNSNGK